MSIFVKRFTFFLSNMIILIYEHIFLYRIVTKTTQTKKCNKVNPHLGNLTVKKCKQKNFLFFFCIFVKQNISNLNCKLRKKAIFEFKKIFITHF